jgi:hypothetical protein
MTTTAAEIIDSLEDWAGEFTETGKQISPYDLLDKLSEFEV